METENNEETQGFVAKLNNYKILKQFFQAVNVNEGGTASFYLQSHGLKMTVEDSKTFQANAFLDHNIFNEFTYTPEQDLGFNLQLKSILDVLNIFGFPQPFCPNSLNRNLCPRTPSAAIAERKK